MSQSTNRQKKNRMAPCRLCLRDSKLCHSHIIPEFLYKPLYENRKFFAVRLGQEPKQYTLQKGAREYLLCADCENQFSKYEGYTRDIVFGNPRKPIKRQRITHNQEQALLLEDLDYKSLKLFQLSLLWRAGISSHPLFEEVKLGENHAEKLRNLLLSQNPGPEDQYPCLCVVIVHENKPLTGLIVPVQRTNVEACTAYGFTFCGMLWSYFISSHSVPKKFLDLALKQDGTWICGIGSAEPLLRVLAARLPDSLLP